MRAYWNAGDKGPGYSQLRVGPANRSHKIALLKISWSPSSVHTEPVGQMSIGLDAAQCRDLADRLLRFANSQSGEASLMAGEWP